MKPIRFKDWPLVWLLGPQLDWLFYTRKNPDELPNNLTRLRIWLIPIQLPALLLGLLLHSGLCLMISLAVLFVQGMSDWIDGYLAYHKDCATPEGAQLDPRADKLVILPNLLIYGLWSLATADFLPSALLLMLTILAIKLDVESDTWYRHNPGGKSNKFGKLKFVIHVLVAGTGLTTMIIDPSVATKSIIALACALAMLLADFFAQLSLQLKKLDVSARQQKQELPSLLENFAQAPHQIVD